MQRKGIVLQDYQVCCNKEDCWRVYCHGLVAKEVYCNITCRLQIVLQYTFVYCEQKDLGLRNVLQDNFLYCDQQYL